MEPLRNVDQTILLPFIDNIIESILSELTAQYQSEPANQHDQGLIYLQQSLFAVCWVLSVTFLFLFSTTAVHMTWLVTIEVCQVFAYSRVEDTSNIKDPTSNSVSGAVEGQRPKRGSLITLLAWECLGSRPHDNIGNSEDQSTHKFVGKGACS